MSVKTSDILAAFAYYIGHGGYYEKASSASKYLTRDVSNFSANKGSANYTYMGKVCGLNPGSWCAMMVSTAVLEACGGDRSLAKKVMWGVWPYAACNQLYDAAPSGKKHRRSSGYIPKPGDVIVFTSNGSYRTHTGQVYAVDDTYVYTYEGNSGDKACARSYRLNSTGIYGYVELNCEYDTADLTGIKAFQKWLGVSIDGVYGANTKKAAIKVHQKWLNSKYGVNISVDGGWGPDTYCATERLQRGDKSNDVLIWQGILYCRGYDPKVLDGDFGSKTEAATIELQQKLGLNPTGIVDRYTWAKALGYSRPTLKVLRLGSNGIQVKYAQRLLTDHGFVCSTTGVFDAETELAVKTFQKENGLQIDGVIGSATWGKLE